MSGGTAPPRRLGAPPESGLTNGVRSDKIETIQPLPVSGFCREES